MPWRRGPGGQEQPSASAIPSEQGRARGKGAGTGQRPPQGQRREATDPWWWQQAAGACVGGSEEGRREEAGFLKPSQPSKTGQQTDRQLARGSGGHSCFSTYLSGPGRSPAGQGCANLGRHGRASGGGMNRRVPGATAPGWGAGADPLTSPRAGQGPQGREEADEALLLREPLCPLGPCGRGDPTAPPGLGSWDSGLEDGDRTPGEGPPPPLRPLLCPQLLPPHVRCRSRAW